MLPDFHRQQLHLSPESFQCAQSPVAITPFLLAIFVAVGKIMHEHI